MQGKRGRILWIDSTISELKSYVRFLEYQGYDVSLTDSGVEGIALLRDWTYHAVLLNHEGAPPKGNNRRKAGDNSLYGNLLSHIRKEDAHIPIVLLTSEVKEGILQEASLYEVDNVLIMPTSPRQLAASLTFLIEKQTMREAHTPQAYVQNFNKQHILGQRQMDTSVGARRESDWQAWIDTYLHLVEWDIRLDALHNADELKAIHAIEKREANAAFANYIQDNYSRWLVGEDSPTLSVDVLYKYVIPEIQTGKPVLFVVMDCMRLDHWLKIEPLLYHLFHITREYYYSIVPTSTRYARNAIFSGLFPLEMAQRHPDLCPEPDEFQTSINQYEKELMRLQLERHGILLKPPPHYFKIFDARGERQYLQWLTATNRVSLAAVVVDFLDMLTHTRYEVALLQQLIPDESAFRTLVQAWFQHSQLYKMLKTAAERGITVVLTSDHGSVLCQNAAKISSQCELTTGLRFKEGKDILCNPESAGLLVKNPEAYGLPNDAAGKNYILAKEDCYFVYDRQFNVYKEIFHGSFQHGGISLEEMILPCIVLEPR